MPSCSIASTSTPTSADPDPETGEAINISHMLPRSLEDLHRRQVGLARLSEGTAGLMGRTPDYMNMKFSAFGWRPRVWAGDDGRNARGAENIVAYRDTSPVTTWPSRTRSSNPRSTSAATLGSWGMRTCTRSARRAMASSCEVAGSSPPSRRSPTRPPCIRPSRCPMALKRTHRVRNPAFDSGSQVLVPRLGVRAERRSVRQATVVPFRRAGRLLHVRRRGRASAIACSSTATSDVQLDVRDELLHPHGQPVDHPRVDQARVRLRPRVSHGRDDRGRVTGHHRNARRARLLRRGDPFGGRALDQGAGNTSTTAVVPPRTSPLRR